MVLMRTGVLQRLADARQLCLRCAVRHSWAAGVPRPAFRVLGGSRLLSTTNAPRSVASEQVETTVWMSRSNTQLILTRIWKPLDGEDESALDEQESLQAQLETYRNVRVYLRKWQESNPNVLDPIQELHKDTTEGGQTLWNGTMINGREAGDSVWAESQLAKRDDFDTSEEFEGEHLEPGDMVARISSDGVFHFAIYVRSVHKQKQYYTDRGNWRICSNREIDYVVKGFAPRELLEPIKPYFPVSLAYARGEIQSVPEGGLPRPLGAPLLKMMANYQAHVLDFYRDHSNLLDDLHHHVADDYEYLRLTLEEMTMKVLSIEESELNSVNLFAVHRAVRSHPFIIEKDSDSYFSAMYLVQPKRIAKVVKQVTDWVHEHQDYLLRAVMGKETPGFVMHPMQQFIQRAQRLIRLSRKVRSPTIMASVGPSSQKFQPGQDDKPLVYREIQTEKFSENDRMIIEYLQLYAIPSVVMPSGTLRSTASHIMRATGMYNTLGLSESSTRLFLQELGVIAPWENLGLLDQILRLPGHGMSLLEDMRWEELEEIAQSISEPLPDSMKEFRKDWGDLPVYCVDDATAQEIDDGVSLERVPGSNDIFWVHIHVANPTAFLKHDDPTMEYAGSRLATTYVPERTYPILPTALTQGHFSLAAGRPTLTFSAKMNLQGEILDTEVTNGTIRNVISLTHGTLRDFLKNTESKPSSGVLTVGGDFADPAPTHGKVLRDTLSTEDKETFTTLRQLMLGFRTQRQKNGAIALPPRLSTSVSVQMGATPAKPYDMQVMEGKYIVGDPIIQLRMHDFDPHAVPDESKENLISLLMNLAGHIAGRFCAARNIPAVFDGTWYDPEYGRVTPQNVANFGGQSFFQLSLPKGVSTSSPIQHHILGLDAYVKSTSPLRRYTDMIAHYQIEAALRFEHEHGRPFNALSDPTSILPFTKSDLDAHIFNSQPIKTRLRDVSSFSTQHWACMLLFRAFYFGECELPDSFPVLLQTPRLVPQREGTVYSGTITNLGVDCVVTIPDDCPGKEECDIFGVVEACITAVDMATLEVKVEATGLIKPFERTGEWA